MPTLAEDLARWAHAAGPDRRRPRARRPLAARHARGHRRRAPLTARARSSRDLPEAARWAALGHVLDFDDLHMESTAHISVVCVPAALAAGGGRSRLPGRRRRHGPARHRAGVAALLGRLARDVHVRSAGRRGRRRPSRSGLDAEATARAIALAVPAAGGVQRSFGTHAKPLQVGFATDAGVRAARLAAAGATADPAVLETWMLLVGGDPAAVDLSGPAVPGGLAVKVHPCCYALQRPIAATRELGVPAARRRARPRAHARRDGAAARARPADDRPGGQVQPRVRRSRPPCSTASRASPASRTPPSVASRGDPPGRRGRGRADRGRRRPARRASAS